MEQLAWCLYAGQHFCNSYTDGDGHPYPNGDGDGAPFLEIQSVHEEAEAVMAAYKACVYRK